MVVAGRPEGAEILSRPFPGAGLRFGGGSAACMGRIFLLLIVLGLVANQGFAQAKPGSEPCTAPHLEHTLAIAGYVVKTFEPAREDGQACLLILRSGRIVFRLADESSYAIGQAADEADGIPAIKPGADLSGNGKPDLIVQSSTGGAHCCYTVRVVELGSKLRVLDKYDAEDGDLSHFLYDQDGHKYVFTAADWSFAYWHTSFAQSPAPKVVLNVSGNDADPAHLAVELMRQPLPASTELDAQSRAVQGTFEQADSDAIPQSPELWTTMLTLIYTGHADAAWQFLDGAWPAGNPHKEAFLGAFCEKLSGSPYWGDLKKMMKTAPSGCIAFSE